MRYFVRQKLISFGDDFTIKDEEGKDHFFVDGKAFTDKLSFEDMQGKQLAYIERREGAKRVVFEIHRDGALFATVTAPKLTFAECHFHVDVPGPDDYDARGDFQRHEFEFVRRGQPVAKITRQHLRLTDAYVVDIAEGEDAVLLLASTVVLDLMCDAQRDQGSRV